MGEQNKNVHAHEASILVSAFLLSQRNRSSVEAGMLAMSQSVVFYPCNLTKA